MPEFFWHISSYSTEIFEANLVTVPTTPVWTNPVLFTKQPKLTMLFYYVKVPSHSSLPGPTLALNGALKWGTVWTSTSTGTEIAKGQCLSNQIYLIKMYVQLWPFTIFLPVEVEVRTVPHFKASFNA